METDQRTASADLDFCDLRNERIRALLGVEFRPWDVSLRDCVESLLAVAGVQPKRQPG